MHILLFIRNYPGTRLQNLIQKEPIVVLHFFIIIVMAHYKGAASEGNRAVTLLKKREQAREEFEFMKKRISEV